MRWRGNGEGEGLVQALDAAELEVARGETVAVMGPTAVGSHELR